MKNDSPRRGHTIVARCQKSQAPALLRLDLGHDVCIPVPSPVQLANRPYNRRTGSRPKHHAPIPLGRTRSSRRNSIRHEPKINWARRQAGWEEATGVSALSGPPPNPGRPSHGERPAESETFGRSSTTGFGWPFCLTSFAGGSVVMKPF